MNKVDVSVVIPAFNEARVIGDIIERTFNVFDRLPYTMELLVIDDGSSDRTAIAAQEAGADVIRHPYNIGNGAAVKTGIRNAAGKIIVLLDGDGQHAPEDIPRLLDQMRNYDLVVGARTRNSESQVHRDVANQIYNWLASYICNRKIEDLTSGFRAIRADMARAFAYLLPNTFSYPTTITLATIHSGYSLAYVPIKAARRVGKSKIKPLRDGWRFFLIILKIATFFSPLKVFVPTSILMFLVGVGYGLFKILFLNSRYGPTSAMLMIVAVLIFLVGLVSEQVAQLRFNRTENILHSRLAPLQLSVSHDKRQNSVIERQVEV